MNTVLIVFTLWGLLVFNFRVEEKFAGRKFRGRKISRNSMRSGYLFRGRKISRKIEIREYNENFLHAKNSVIQYLIVAMSCIAQVFSGNNIGGMVSMFLCQKEDKALKAARLGNTGARTLAHRTITHRTLAHRTFAHRTLAHRTLAHRLYN